MLDGLRERPSIWGVRRLSCDYFLLGSRLMACQHLRFSISVPLACWLLWTGSGQAESAPPQKTETVEQSSYCQWVAAEADAERMLLVSPEAFAAGGLVAAGSLDPSDGQEDTLVGVKPRLTAGLRYRFVNIYRQSLIRRRARSECRRHSLLQRLASASKGVSTLGRGDGVAAQLEVLRHALPQARRHVEELRERVSRREAPIQKLYTLRLRYNAMEDAVVQLELEAQRLGRPSRPARAPLRRLLREQLAADNSFQQAQHQLERARAWEVDVRAAYDQVYGLDRQLPLVAQVQMTFNFGMLFQPGAHRRAEAARRAHLTSATDQIGQRIREALAQIEQAVPAERKRLKKVERLEAELSARMHELAAVDSELAREQQRWLWFEVVELRGELALQRKRVEAMQAYLVSAKR